jgi:nitrite reductase (NO-forming)
MGEIFDTLYEYGSTSSIRDNVQTALVPAGGAAIVDVALEVPGNYVLLDHSISRTDKGAWGILQATGKENLQIYRGITK